MINGGAASGAAVVKERVYAYAMRMTNGLTKSLIEAL